MFLITDFGMYRTPFRNYKVCSASYLCMCGFLVSFSINHMGGSLKITFKMDVDPVLPVREDMKPVLCIGCSCRAVYEVLERISLSTIFLRNCLMYNKHCLYSLECYH